MNIRNWFWDNLKTNPQKLVIWLIIVGSIVRIIIAAFTGLGIGESYYFRGAKEIHLAYYDQPPLFFWTGYLSLKLFGTSNLALRLPSILFFAGTCWMLFKITSRLYSPQAAFWSVLILNISLVFTIPVAVWFQPDAPLMFFWLVTCWLMIKIISLGDSNSEKTQKIYLLWFLAGLSLGLTFLSKYHALFIPLATGIFMLFNKKYRWWLAHPAPYLAMVVFILIVSPVIFWNWKNDWVSFSFQGSRAVGEFRLHPEWLLRSILGQIIWLAPWIFFPLITELVKLWRSARGNPINSFLLVLSALPVMFFTIVSLWSNSKYHFHWQAPGYLMLMVPLGASIARYIQTDRRKTLKWINGSVIATVAVSFLLLLHTETGIIKRLTGLGNNNFLSFDPTIEGYDYKDIQKRFNKEGWTENDNLFVVSTTWWQTGKIDWALKGEKDIVVLHQNPRNYTFYGENPRNLIGKDAILLRYKKKANNTAFTSFFKEVKILDDVTVTRRGMSELKLEVFYCKQFSLPDSAMTDYPAYNMMKGEKPYKNLKNK